MWDKFGPNPKVALVCRGGPENGPFSAMAARLITEALTKKGIDVSAIYACSGSTPTALLGCTGNFQKVCDLWANITPEEIVGSVRKSRIIFRMLRRESFWTSSFLRKKIEENLDLNKVFSSEARMIKFPAVDLLSSEYIIFSNKKPGHKRWFKEGVLGSMGLIPFLQPQMVYDAVEAGLIDQDKATYFRDSKTGERYNGMLLIDGGYQGNMLLEEAMRDGFNLIFIIDVHGLKPTETNLLMRYHWTELLKSSHHLLSNTNDIRQYQLADRANEEIEIRDDLVDFKNTIPPEYAERLNRIIDRMDSGRLRLGDKQRAEFHIVASEEHSLLFNFTKFKQHEVLRLMSAGLEAANKKIRELGLD